ncbi:hypothetical protein AB205_0141960 [Aquarana catesbeiana]|uniref:Uncharacterized protein n=1 Tax=Aquarana catesbeiana TaxID=8400 RepID=A0A2G9Q1R1_AQUCT|nr:hypothetical protein AB205_0141960 [Aquarana catesbeiana]
MMFFKKIRTSLMFWGEFKTPPNPFVFWCATILTFFCQIVEKPNFEEAHSVSTCAICHRGRSMEAFWGCNPFLNNKVAERKGLLPQNMSLDPRDGS